MYDDQNLSYEVFIHSKEESRRHNVWFLNY